MNDVVIYESTYPTTLPSSGYAYCMDKDEEDTVLVVVDKET